MAFDCSVSELSRDVCEKALIEKVTMSTIAATWKRFMVDLLWYGFSWILDPL
jgi:hypothetical protein